MATSSTDGARRDGSVPIRKIFHVIGEQGADVIAAALEHRGDVSTSARDSLNAAIDNSGITIDGFKKPSTAPFSRLSERVHWEAGLNDKLAGAVLRVWAEHRKGLADVVSEHLGEKTIPLDARRDSFHKRWPKNICLLEGDMISSQHAELEGQDIALMLCYLSGRFPEDTSFNSQLFSEWHDHFESLPPEAPEWDEVPEFIAGLIGISKAKTSERDLARREAFDAAVAEIAERFEAELRYLETSISSWAADIEARPDLVSTAHDLAISLRSALEAYCEVQPQAPTRQEEEQRVGERRDREADVLSIIASWGELMNTQDVDEPVGEEPEAGVSAEEFALLRAENDGLASENEELRADQARLTQARDMLRQTSEQLRAENVRLTRELETSRHSYDRLRMEKENESEENSDLRRRLSELEAWRAASSALEEQDGEAEAGEPQVDSVRGAIAFARERFPDALLIKLNSASEEGSPFRRPDEVYRALAWLATEYRQLRTSPPGAAPDFNRRLKEVCPGWEYRAGQSDTALGMFKTDYETVVDGTVYRLEQHIGKGSRGDPQYMIRIAFAWDGDLQKVIVGYVGRHQRTQAT